MNIGSNFGSTEVRTRAPGSIRPRRVVVEEDSAVAKFAPAVVLEEIEVTRTPVVVKNIQNDRHSSGMTRINETF